MLRVLIDYNNASDKYEGRSEIKMKQNNNNNNNNDRMYETRRQVGKSGSPGTQIAQTGVLSNNPG